MIGPVDRRGGSPRHTAAIRRLVRVWIVGRSITETGSADLLETEWREPCSRRPARTTGDEFHDLGEGEGRGFDSRLPLSESKERREAQNEVCDLDAGLLWPYRLRTCASELTGNGTTFFPRPLNLRRFRSPFLGCWTKAMFCTLRRNPTDRLPDLSPAGTLTSGRHG